MLQHINGARSDGTLERRFQTYLRPDLLVLDDYGLKPLHPPAPEDLYDIINERYGRGSILPTSLSYRTDRAIARPRSGLICSATPCWPQRAWTD